MEIQFKRGGQGWKEEEGFSAKGKGKTRSIANLKLVIELNLNKGGHEEGFSHYTSKKLLAAYLLNIYKERRISPATLPS